MAHTLRIVVVGDFDPTFTAHLATNESLPHSARLLDVEVEVERLPTEPLEHDLAAVEAADALWVACGTRSPSLAARQPIRARSGGDRDRPPQTACASCTELLNRSTVGFTSSRCRC
jgi:hypothetical protein